MKYKIIYKKHKTLKDLGISSETKSKVTIKESEWYIAKRKGNIFGFWHKVGHKCDYDGNTICYEAHTIPEMEDYIRKYHEVRYSKYPIEIVKEIEL